MRGRLVGVSERLQKILARAGVASRRHAEELIKAGRVSVNGVVATLGQSASETDLIAVDDKPILRGAQHVTFALYKPRGIVTTASDEFGRRNVLELVPEAPGLHPVGRLDRNSEGLLILTTDGDLTLELTHPRYQHEKEYRVWTDPEPTDEQLEEIWEGVDLDDGFAKPIALKSSPKGALIVLGEGRNRQVRRMFEAVGLEVVRLQRRRIGALELEELRPGDYRELNADDIERLRAHNYRVRDRDVRERDALRERSRRQDARSND
jgi:23S rRNA pseudouridine2605 synthase